MCVLHLIVTVHYAIVSLTLHGVVQGVLPFTLHVYSGHRICRLVWHVGAAIQLTHAYGEITILTTALW